MAQWYCVIQGQQYGPVSEEELRGWITEGRVGFTDLVWTEGMAEWVEAGSLTELFAAADGFGGGTGGRTPNKVLMAQAREVLRGRWGLAIGFGVLLFLVQFGIRMVPFVGGIGGLILQGPFELGAIIFFLAISRRANAELGMMFHGFRSFGRALGAFLLRVIFVILWSLLFIIPGIIATLRYSQTFYLLADYPTLGPLEAIRKSKAMMVGHKWKLFCLGLRFIGWALLCILSLGIGFLWLTPYIAASHARFYNDLRVSVTPAAVQAPEPPEPLGTRDPAFPR